MEGEKSLQLSPMPLIPRLDRLDQLLNYLEERRDSSGRYPSTVTELVSNVPRAKRGQHIKSLVSVLEEVPSKGSLMERVAAVENRVLELYLEMEGGGTLDVSNISLPEESEDTSAREERKTSDAKKRRRRRVDRIFCYRRWLRWTHISCSRSSLCSSMEG